MLVKVVNAWFACLQPHVGHQPHVAGSHAHVSRAGFWRLTEQEANTGSANLQIGGSQVRVAVSYPGLYLSSSEPALGCHSLPPT